MNLWRRGASCLAIVGIASAAAAQSADRPAPAGAQSSAPAAAAQNAKPQPGRTIGEEQKLPTLTLVRSAGTRAVVRFGSGALETISKGDRLGSTHASVVEITTGRLVLEEITQAVPGGPPNRVLIVLKDGETGGTRYSAQPGENPLPALKPVVIDPGAAKNPAKPAAKTAPKP